MSAEAVEVRVELAPSGAPASAAAVAQDDDDDIKASGGDLLPYKLLRSSTIARQVVQEFKIKLDAARPVVRHGFIARLAEFGAAAHWLLETLVVFPLGQCCRGRGVMLRWRRMATVTLWIFLVLFAAYGVVNMFKLNAWSSDDDLYTRPKVMLGLARLTGKATTCFLLASFLLALKPVHTYLDQIPEARRRWMRWRSIHYRLGNYGVLCGLLHGVFHYARVSADSSTGWDVPAEKYFGLSGALLVLLFGIMIAPFFAMRALAHNWVGHSASWPKQLFRRTHRQLVPLLSFVYAVHSLTIWFPTVCAVWLLCMYIAKLKYSGLAYSCKDTPHATGARVFEKITDKSELEIVLTIQEDIPIEYGMYCMLRLNGVQAAYTLVPVRDSEAGVHHIKFRIKNSVFLREFNKVVSAEQNAVSPSAQRHGSWRISAADVKLRVYGPFHSTDLGARCARQLVAIFGVGGATVGEGILSYMEIHPDFWDQGVVLVQLATGSGEYVSFDRRASVSTVLPAADLGDVAKAISDGVAGTRNPLSTPVQHMVCHGHMDEAAMYRILSAMGPSSHLIVCSRPMAHLARQVVTKAYKPSPDAQPLDLGMLDRFHFEDFFL